MTHIALPPPQQRFDHHRYPLVCFVGSGYEQESFIDETFGAAATYPLLPFRETEDRLLARHGIARDDVTVEDEDDVLE